MFPCADNKFHINRSRTPPPPKKRILDLRTRFYSIIFKECYIILFQTISNHESIYTIYKNYIYCILILKHITFI